MNNTKIFKTSPSVLAFQRGLIATDAAFYSVDANGNETPVTVSRNTRIGVQSRANNKTASNDNTSVASSATVSNVTNPYTSDEARTSAGTKSVNVRFDLKFVDMDNLLFASASAAPGELREFNASIHSFIERCKKSEGLRDVCNRMARNIANGRWLWRNRTYASTIVTEVTVGNEVYSFNAIPIATNHFDNFSEDEISLGEHIYANLIGTSVDVLRVLAKVDFGVSGSFEVYPSQLFPTSQDKADKADKGAKQLYTISGNQAALRDQKVTNAIKTIDTWFDDYDRIGEPIAVEMDSPSLKYQEYFRTAKTSAFEYIKQLNVIDPNTDTGKFMMSCLIRGGVFPSKRDTKAKKDE